MMLELDDRCTRFGIDFSIGGGNALGAVRNGGFLPWDDDVDIYITRDNFEKMLAVRDEFFSDDFILVDYKSHPGYGNPLPRIVSTDDTVVSKSRLADGTPKGTFLELFVLDPMPNDPVQRREWLELHWLYTELVALNFRVASPYVEEHVNLERYEEWLGRCNVEGRFKVLAQLEEQLFHAQTDAEKENLRMQRTRLCAEEDSEETKVRRAMGAALASLADGLLEDAETLGRLDFIIQKALFAVRYGGILPEITDGELELTDMVNPELCDLLEQKGRRFVPVSIALTRGATVITGANMGGKSVAMKTVALNVLLLQAGFLVCAKRARMPLFHSVKMLFDDLQSIQSGLSGFGSEIVEFQKALSEVEEGYSLFLLDEFARGTNPDEGARIVQAVTRYLNDVDAISLLTTHYDKVAEFAHAHYQIIGLRDVDPEEIRRELAASGEDGVAVIARHMNYGLYRVEGASDCPRDALNICRMLSLKPEILEKIQQAY